MKKVGEKMTPTNQSQAQCVAFNLCVRNVQAAVIHTYQLTAFASLQEPDPGKAAVLWKEMSKFCESALVVLRSLKDSYPYCGAPELYDLALDYRSEAERRYADNQQDSECANPPAGLFPKMN